MQTLLTVAAVVGPLVGVALGAFLASRFQQSHWFQDRRLDAFVAAQTAVYRVVAASLVAAKFDPPEPEDQNELHVATTQWVDACERLDLLAGASVMRTSIELREVMNAMVSAANKKGLNDLDSHVEAARKLRLRLTDEMRKELRTR
jgi:hypothetical protein